MRRVSVVNGSAGEAPQTVADCAGVFDQAPNTIQRRCLTIILLVVVGTAMAAPLAAAESVRPESFPSTTAPLRFFQRYLSAADGDRCPMTPSCSHYAIDAIQRHGVVKGWIMTCDRLLRCGRDELTVSPSVRTPRGLRSVDPIENNDFWLR